MIPYLDYDGRLRVLGMEALGFRRIVTDGILLHKILNGTLITTAKNEISMRQNHFNIRNMSLFGIKTHTINCAYYNVLPRTMRRYNMLFGAVDIFDKPIKEFKRIWIDRLTSLNLNVFGTLLNCFTTPI